MLGVIFERTICFNILQESPNMLATIFNSPSSVHNFAAMLVPLEITSLDL